MLSARRLRSAKASGSTRIGVLDLDVLGDCEAETFLCGVTHRHFVRRDMGSEVAGQYIGIGTRTCKLMCILIRTA